MRIPRTFTRITQWCGRARQRRDALVFPCLLGLVAISVVVAMGPQALDDGRLLLAQDDPVALGDRVVAARFDAPTADREITAALAADDPDLAASFLDLARARGVPVDTTLAGKVAQANSAAAATLRTAGSFGRGLVTGVPADGASLAGTAVGDLFWFGDVRDALREGHRFANGEKPDEIILGLACVGLALTAGTYVSFGAAAPARIGVSVVKASYRAGKISMKLAAWMGRSLRAVVDVPAARRAIAGGSVLQPASAVRALRESVKLEKAGGLGKMLTDVGRVQSKAGTRAALDGLKLADEPKDVARLATLAERNGSKTRAILKLGGRAALVVTTSLFNLAAWSFSALLWLFWCLALVKSTTERVTRRLIARRKRREAARPIPSTVLAVPSAV